MQELCEQFESFDPFQVQFESSVIQHEPFYFFKPTEDESDILKEEIRSLQVSFQKLILSFSYKNNK